ncbi:MAG: CRISPR-associated protein Cas4 [Deferribacteraceae bacterium]|jgi:CRISPR-associated exonuclease Cas4|nr:CRISPR-associated protein Cas4 [Deferribacteraceae bacterium]
MITGSEFAYYYLCARKLWLFSHAIHMEHESDRVAEGRLLHETSYSREKKEIDMFGCVIDHFDNKNNIIHEVKLSPAVSDVHIKQLQYYIYRFKHEADLLCTGMIDYPKLKRKQPVTLSDADEEQIETDLAEIMKIKTQASPPPSPEIMNNICKSCAYAAYCFA